MEEIAKEYDVIVLGTGTSTKLWSLFASSSSAASIGYQSEMGCSISRKLLCVLLSLPLSSIAFVSKVPVFADLTPLFCRSHRVYPFRVRRRLDRNRMEYNIAELNTDGFLS